jgi:hypothetical protein
VCSSPRRRALLALAFFIVLAAIHTWPLVTAPATLTRHDNADTFLNQWTLAWVAHAVAHQPLRLFEANIFHPEPHTLAYSEHLVVQGLMGAPLAWLGASPVLVCNIVVLAGLALTGWATALVVAGWTRDWPAALLAGSVAAFNTHTLSRLVHVQALHVEFLPLALLALDRLLARPRVRHALALAAWAALQMLCSGYLLVFTVVTLASAAAARAREWLPGEGARRALPMLALAALLAFVVATPFLVPYRQVRAEQGLVRDLDEVARYSATGRSYLSTVGNLHYAWWSHRFYDRTDALFPGVVPLALAAWCLATGTAWRDRRARMVLAAGAVCVALSFGPAFPPYRWVYHALPLLQGIRGAARFGYVAILSTGVLAAFGLASLRGRARPGAARRAWLAAALVLVGAANVETLTAPHEYTAFRGVPAPYRALALEPEAVVVELPFWPVEAIQRNGPYVLNSTRHWHPLLNGYSGFVPESYRRHAAVLASFPDEPGLALLRKLGVTHVVVHVEDAPGLADRLSVRDGFALVAVGPGLRVYRFR